MARRSRIAATIAMVVVGLSLAGCGASGDDKAAPPESTTAPAVPSKAEYLNTANALCAEMNSGAIALSKDYAAKSDTPANEAGALRANADLIESTITKLEALPRPAGDETVLATAFAKASQLPSAARDLATAVEQGDQAQIAALQASGDQAQTSANDAANAYGLTTCGSGSSSSTA